MKMVFSKNNLFKVFLISLSVIASSNILTSEQKELKEADESTFISAISDLEKALAGLDTYKNESTLMQGSVTPAQRKQIIQQFAKAYHNAKSKFDTLKPNADAAEAYDALKSTLGTAEKATNRPGHFIILSKLRDAIIAKGGNIQDVLTANYGSVDKFLLNPYRYGNINAKNSILQMAAARGLKDLVELLLAYGFNPLYKIPALITNAGKNSIDFAAGKEDVIKPLKAAGGVDSSDESAI